MPSANLLDPGVADLMAAVSQCDFAACLNADRRNGDFSPCESELHNETADPKVGRSIKLGLES